LVALLLAGVFSPSIAGNPHSAFYSSSNDKIIWFIHASDTHVGTRGSTDSTNLQWLVTTAKNTISPSFIVVSGDLTDSTNGNILGYPNGPYQAEWDEYKSIVDSNVTSTTYYDIPGNHDAYNDQYFAYYLANSVQGRAMGRTQQSWTRNLVFGEYHFLGVNTADNTGNAFSLSWPYGDHAGLDSTELAFITSELQAHPNATLTLVFGHHPLAATGNSSDTYIYYGRDEFVSLMNGNGASLYGYGHTHVSSESFYTQGMTEGVFYFNVSALGKDSPNQYTMTAIDCNGIASVTQTVNTWPVVLITAPMDKYLGGTVNPYTYSIPNSATNPIRALVFDTAALNQVQYRIDAAGSWYPMQRTAVNNPNYPHLWEATWNASAIVSGEHTIEVQATTTSGVGTDTVWVNIQGTVGIVFASFPGYGLWRWDGTAWARLTSDMPESMAASGSTLYGDFGAQGLWKYDGSSWSLLTPDNPQTMAVSGSTLYADFGSLGLWKYDGTSWSQLTSDNPENIVASGSTVYGDFGTQGLWKHDGTSWSRLTTDNPENMAVSGTTLYVDFGPIGLWKHDGTNWSQLTSDNPENIAVSGSTLFGDFGSLGLWKWSGSSWSLLTPDNPENIAASGTALYGDFGSIGLWKWDGTKWTWLTSDNPSLLITN
jgi:hypothetical protein